MADPSSASGLLEILWDKAVYTVNYVPVVIIAHRLAELMAIGAGAGLTVVGSSKLAKKFQRGVDTEAVVHGETFLDFTGEINPATGNEFIDLVIHTYDEFTLHDYFEKSLKDPDTLAYYFRKAAKKDGRIVPSHLVDVVKVRDNLFLRALPSFVSKRLGHLTQGDKDEMIEEMGRCYRGFYARRLTPKHVEGQPRNAMERERLEWHRKIVMLVYEPSAEGEVFRSISFDPSLMERGIPNKEDVRLVFSDPDDAKVRPGHYLYDRIDTMEGILQELEEDYEFLKQFIPRYTLGDMKTVAAPVPKTPST